MSNYMEVPLSAPRAAQCYTATAEGEGIRWEPSMARENGWTALCRLNDGVSLLISATNYVKLRSNTDSVDLDLSPLGRSAILSAKAFETANSVVIQLVDAMGCIFAISVVDGVPQSFQPISVATQPLHPGMICHYRHDTILVASAAQLLQIHLPSRQMRPWHDSSTTKSWFTPSKKKQHVAPVASLTSFQHYVVTLHSDAQVRLWTDRQTATIIHNGSALPTPSTWTGTIQLQATRYNNDQVYAIALYIATTDAPQLVILSGTLTSTATIQVQQVPPGSLASMTWQQPQAGLHLWIDQTLWHYPHHMVELLGRQPHPICLHQHVRQQIQEFAIDTENIHDIDVAWLAQLMRLGIPESALGAVLQQQTNNSHSLAHLAVTGVHAWSRGTNHQDTWRQLLLKSLEPAPGCLEYSDNGLVLLRPHGRLSRVLPTPTAPAAGMAGMVDEVAWALVKDHSESLVQLEHDVYTSLARGRLSVPDVDIAPVLAPALTHRLANAQDANIVAFLQKPPPTLVEDVKDADGVAVIRSALVAASRLALGRWLVLRLTNSDHIGRVAQHAWLYILSLQWCVSQPVAPLPGGVKRLKQSATRNVLEWSLSRVDDDESVVWQKLFDWNKTSVTTPQDLPDLALVPTLDPPLALRLLQPAILCRVNPLRIRDQVFAEVLLNVCESFPREQAHMTQQAFALLQFDAVNLEQGLANLETLQRFANVNPDIRQDYLYTVHEAIASMESRSMVPPDKLWALLFDGAVQARDWEKAYAGAKSVAHLERLVRSMVDAGDLATLLTLVSNTSLESDQHRLQAFGGVDLYSVASKALEEARDVYSLRLTSTEPLADYPGALVALHASRDEWRRVAQAHDLRFVTGRQALVPSWVDPAVAQQRELLILEDMVQAAAACADSIRNVTDPGLQFIVSGEYGRYPSLPLVHASAETALVVASPGGKPPVASMRRERYMDKARLDLRAIRTRALERLIKDDDNEAYEFAKKTLLEEVPSELTDQTVIDHLFRLGYYPEGLALSRAMDRVNGAGENIFIDSLSHLLCDYLLPVATKGLRGTLRPTLSQIQTAFDTLSSAPSLLVLSAYKQLHLLDSSSIQQAAMALLRQYVVKYTTPSAPLATDVASHLIRVEHTTEPLPTWLEDFLLYGTERDEYSPGLFHRRPKDGRKFLGDPSTLVTLYTERGLYLDATRIVSVVLNAPGQQERAAKRLPEKGDMDCVPYNKIDMLYNLMGVVSKKPGIPQETLDELSEARGSLETSLETHFNLLRVSEIGLKSARLVK